MKKTWAAVLISVSLMQGLSGCAALAVGGLAAGGLSAVDRRSTGSQADDQLIELQVSNNITTYLRNQYAADVYNNVKVISYNRSVLLIGMVSDQNAKDTAERIARSQSSVNRVFNHIDIGAERSINAAQDTWITSKIRAMLLQPKGYNPSHVKITTFNGTTYAQGVLTPEEQAAINQQISTTLGVQKVVTLYETFVSTNVSSTVKVDNTDTNAPL